MINTSLLGSKTASLRVKSPLVLNLTNYVAMNFSANVLLAAGASPLMSFFADEMEEIVPKCDALVINAGCLDADFIEGARKAARTAISQGIPWVLDPVGVGISAQRKDFCVELIRDFHPVIIRANASEVATLAALLCKGQARECGRGADSTLASGEAVEDAKALAAATGCTVSMSGATDYITDGQKVLCVEGGSPLMPQITAMGCSASALTAALAAVEKEPLEAAYWAMAIMARAGEMAAAKASLPGSFVSAFIDAMASLGKSRFNRESLKLYLVTDRGLAGEKSILDIASEAAKGGATMVQLREKEISTEEFVRLGLELKKVLKPLGVPLIINDRVDVAIACDADGVHIGQSDMPYETARKMLGPDKIIGLSVENMDQVVQANSLDVDYIGVSPVFSTPTKTDTAAPFGLEGLREAVRLSVHPTVAIGGMNASTAADVMKQGTDGIAVVSAIVCASDPREASANLLKIMQDGTERLG